MLVLDARKNARWAAIGIHAHSGCVEIPRWAAIGIHAHSGCEGGKIMV